MILLLLLAALLAAPAHLLAQAQAAALRVEGAGESRSVSAFSHRGHTAYPEAALAMLGAQLETEPGRSRAILWGDTLRFEVFSPFFTAAGRLHQLAYPVYREGGVLYLPHQLFAEWLPAHFSERISYRGGTLRVTALKATTAAPRAGAPEPARPVADRTRVVILDAGHGGRDPGKIGPNGVREKDVALATVQRLAALLRAREGYEVHLTRSADTLIALHERPRLANEWKAGRPAALFVSIHANAAPTRAEGFETFFLSEARTEDERRVAEMENAAVAYENGAAAHAADDLSFILQRLKNDYYLRASHQFAEVIQQKLAGFHPGPNRGVKQAGFRVLVGAFMPAVLVEVAFISDTHEAQLLATSAFQQKIAWAVAGAVDEFFQTHEHLWAAGATE